MKVFKNIGWIVFGEVKRYENKKDFEDDEREHLVKGGSNYGWRGKTIYGWVVKESGREPKVGGNSFKGVTKIER